MYNIFFFMSCCKKASLDQLFNMELFHFLVLDYFTKTNAKIHKIFQLTI